MSYYFRVPETYVSFSHSDWQKFEVYETTLVKEEKKTKSTRKWSAGERWKHTKMKPTDRGTSPAGDFKLFVANVNEKMFLFLYSILHNDPLIQDTLVLYNLLLIYQRCKIHKAVAFH